MMAYLRGGRVQRAHYSLSSLRNSPSQRGVLPDQDPSAKQVLEEAPLRM